PGQGARRRGAAGVGLRRPPRGHGRVHAGLARLDLRRQSPRRRRRARGAARDPRRRAGGEEPRARRPYARTPARDRGPGAQGRWGRGSGGGRRNRPRRRERARGVRAPAGERRAVERDAPDGRSPGAAARHRACRSRLGARSLRGRPARARRHAPARTASICRAENSGAFYEGEGRMATFNDCSARFLMCRPEHFAVSYTINPWMNPTRWARDAGAHAAAEREWTALHRKLLELGAAVELVPPAAGLPDLVFTANAAVVLDRQAL